MLTDLNEMKNFCSHEILKATLIIFLIFTVVSGSSGNALAEGEEVFIHDGFVDGNAYIHEVMTKEYYLMGVIDGIFLSPFFGASGDELEWFEDCVEGMTNLQIKAIVGKFMDNNPEVWHQPMHTLVYRAFLNACPKSPKK